jgi:acyl-CoA hydrolase
LPQELDLGSLDLTAIVRAGDTVLWGQAGGEPAALTAALMAQRHAIGGFDAWIGMTLSDAADPAHADCVRFHSYCGSARNRGLAAIGRLDILPCHYSELPGLFTSGRLKIDVLMLQLAPADADGNYSLSIAHEYLIPALAAARLVIAEVNAAAPFTYGERPIRDSDLDYIVRTNRPPLALEQPAPKATELTIAGLVAGLIEDGSTLQFGLGALPEAILSALFDKRDLGIHTGTFGDRAAALMEAGVVTNARKSIDPGFTVAGVIMGGPRAYDFVHRNPSVVMRSTAYTHDRDVLASIDRFVALNSAVEVDLTGQINSEVAGGTYVGAVGGAADFLRGAHQSKGGLPIVALPATARGHSRIVARLNGPVSTARSDAGLIVTEYGIADLRGIGLAERVKRMLAIAAPDRREALERDAHALRLGVD